MTIDYTRDLLARNENARAGDTKEWSPFAIPTTYRGVRFRSRIEARWAAMFDLVQWKWDYEPIDLAGYIPDFVLQMGERQMVAEIKSDTSLAELRSYAPKIVMSGWEHEFLVLGARLFDDGVIGAIGDDHAACFIGEIETDHAVVFRCLSCGGLSVRSESLSWRCRLCGIHDGNSHVGHAERLSELWAEAGNRVQWRPGT